MKSVLKINTSKIGYIYNIDGLLLENKYTLENALVVLLSNLLTNESIKKGDIGLNDNDFYTGLEIINRINENKNILGRNGLDSLKNEMRRFIWTNDRVLSKNKMVKMIKEY